MDTIKQIINKFSLNTKKSYGQNYILDQNITDKILKLINVKNKIILEIANRYSKTPAQIVLRWLNQQNWIAIPKSANENRMKENMKIFDFTISEDDMNSLHSLARNFRAVPCALGTNHQIDLPSKHGVNGLELI